MTTRSLREFTRFIWWMQNSAKWPPTLRPSYLTRAVSPPVSCCSLQPPSPFYYRRKLIFIYRPMEGRRLSWSIGTAGRVHTAQGCKSHWFLRWTQLPTARFDPRTSRTATASGHCDLPISGVYVYIYTLSTLTSLYRCSVLSSCSRYHS